MKYFQIDADDQHYSDRWFLDDPRDKRGDVLDPREFTYGRKYVGPKPSNVPVDPPGRTIAFNMGAFDMPVVSTEIGNVLTKIAKADIELFPVTVGPSKQKGWEILNAVQQIHCVDEKASQFTRFGKDAPQKRLIGKYEMFLKLRIDPDKAAGHHVFRIEDWVVALIVSDDVRRALMPIKNLGIVFLPVTE